MKNCAEKPKPCVRWLDIGPENEGQRLDNFLFKELKGVPKTRIYRIVRKGKVRVNKGRIDAKYRLKINDQVRIPPIRVAERETDVVLQPTLKHALENNILFEDDGFLVLNKPTGFAVHGGSGVQSGVIEGLRVLRPEQKFLELVHRLDKETSGCLLIAKKRSVLKALHLMFQGDGIDKTYVALLYGNWRNLKQRVNQPLLKNINKGGERFVKVDVNGKVAITHFNVRQRYDGVTLVQAKPETGRTHQIRVHAAWMGHPIVCDTKYADPQANQTYRKNGYTRLFLHAEALSFKHPSTEQLISFKAPLPEELQELLKHEQKL